MNNNFGDILKQELILALGCTESIAIAYASSLARNQLGIFPKKIEIIVSENIIRNVKGVTVPNTNGRRGIEIAALAGALSEKPESKLEVLEYVRTDQIERLDELLSETKVSVNQSDGKSDLYIELTEYSNNDVVKVIIEDEHTHVTLISKNGRTLLNGTI